MSFVRFCLFLVCLFAVASCGDGGSGGSSSGGGDVPPPPPTTNVTLGTVTFDTTKSQNLSLNAMKMPGMAESLSYRGAGAHAGKSLVGATLTYSQTLETVRGVPSVKQTWIVVYADGSSDPAHSIWLAYATDGALYAIRHSTTTGYVDMSPAMDTPSVASVGTNWINEYGDNCTVQSTTATTDTGWTGCILIKSILPSGGPDYVWLKPDLGEVGESDGPDPATGTWRIDLLNHTASAPRAND